MQAPFGMTESDLFLPTPSASGSAAEAAPVVEEKPQAAAAVVEKTHFDVKLKSFDAAQKLKVIKEVRAVTNLGLKEVWARFCLPRACPCQLE